MKGIQFKLFTMLVFLLLSNFSSADEPEMFYVEFMNFSRVRIGNKWIKSHDKFMSNNVIHWTNGRQYMRVSSVNDPERIYGITMEGFKEANVKTLYDFLVKKHHASTRGGVLSTHYSRVRHYLIDSLHLKTYNDPVPNVIAEAVWTRSDGREQITRLQRTPDNLFYIVTRDILGYGATPDSLLLNIRERYLHDGWLVPIYRNIPIRCLPFKLD